MAITMLMGVAPAKAPTASPPKPDKEPTVIPYCIAAGVEHLPGACSNRQRIIFVIGLASDPLTKGRLVGSLVDQLQSYDLIGGARLVAEPTWTPDDFISQCKADRTLQHLSTQEGALVIAAVGLASGLEDAFSQWKSKVEAGVNVLYAECNLQQSPPETPYAYIWSSHTQFGKAWKTQANTSRYISLVTGLLSAVGIILSVLPTNTTKTTTTTNFATPTPAATPPSSWMTTSVIEKDSQGASFSTLATALLTQAVSNSSVVPVIPADETQAWNAIEGAVYNVVYEMHCTPSAPTPKPSATPIPAPSATGLPNDDVKKYAEKRFVQLSGKAPFCLPTPTPSPASATPGRTPKV